MTAQFTRHGVTVHLGDCLDVLQHMPDASIDAVVTDPPYELGFMGRAWDSAGVAFDPATWQACLRVLKPGGHLLAFGGTRTWHRLAAAIEDAGFEIRDTVADLTGRDAPGLIWAYGSGFPKSHDVSKAIDKAAGAEREVIGAGRWAGRESAADLGVMNDDAWQRGAARVATAPATDAARAWQGWGTALKPAWEPIILARRPLAGTVAANVLQHGTGALNIDASRVPLGGERPPTGSGDRRGSQVYAQDEWTRTRMSNGGNVTPAAGRWPTNVVLAHDPGCVEGGACADGCQVAELDRQSGWSRSPTSTGRGAGGQHGAYSPIGAQGRVPAPGDAGGASRFFPTFRYQAKAPNAERPRLADGTAHPTVKPLALLRWLVRLVAPPGGVVLDPFAGSGTTGEACAVEGFECVLIEREPQYVELIGARLSRVSAVQTTLENLGPQIPQPRPAHE